MQTIPMLGAHGIATAGCIDREEVIVMDRDEVALWLRFSDSDSVWPLGWAAFFSGRFMKFSECDMEDVAWL